MTTIYRVIIISGVASSTTAVSSLGSPCPVRRGLMFSSCPGFANAVGSVVTTIDVRSTALKKMVSAVKCFDIETKCDLKIKSLGD
jgi:hypothetical protein